QMLFLLLIVPVAVAQMGGWGGGGGGRWGAGNWPGPQWLQQASPATQQAVKQLFQDRSIDRESRRNQIRALMQRESPQVQAAFAQHESQRSQWRQQMEQRYNQVSATMSPQARAASEQLRTMMHDRSIPRGEKRNRMQAFKATLPQSVQTELQQAMQQMWPGG
ncbi:hypothetical protein PMAYCL1PPCAC_15502, partial [Pristionchus mayeri]